VESAHGWNSVKKRGVDVVGLTLSHEQSEVIKKKGMTSYVKDYRVFDEKFVGDFDAITLLGSAEHICTSQGFYSCAERCEKTYNSLYHILYKYLKPGGEILMTVLVKQNRDFTIYDYSQAYIMERHYGGYYTTEEMVSSAIENNELSIESVKDFTKDYHWVSIVEPTHFGHWSINWLEDPLDKITYIVRGLIMDPFLIHHWLYYACDTWMWQFGGYQKTPLTDEQVQKAHANLKYFKVKKNI
jgi:cyclopropane fatty-acyl-phospholipid synthase-like methyltransferase